MKQLWQISILISLLFALVANFLTGANKLNLPPINEISDKYATLITPATYAFSIWSLIYVLLTALAIYQARDLFNPQKDNDLPQKLGPLFTVANICNGLWTYIFLKELIGLSVFVLLLLTATLYALLIKLRIAIYYAPLKVIAFVWWPLLIYTGWVTIATIVNIASCLRSVDVTITPVVASVLIVLVGASLLVLMEKRNVRELVLASTWAITAIGVRQIDLADGNTLVANTAFVTAGLLVAAVALHAYKNRELNILYVFRRANWNGRQT